VVPVAQESTVEEAGLDQSSSASAERSFDDLYADTVELEQALSARTITLEEKLIQIATAQTVIAQRATEFAQARDDLGELQQLLVEAQEKVIACSMAYQDAVKVHHERTGDAVAANYEVCVTREQLYKATATFQAAAKDKAAHIYSIFHRM
jgi:chromosome segregation ATPase